MANGNEQAPIIKKVKKSSHHAHHGGAWKVAYADFVTAMMAFFLLLWLLSTTTDEQKEGIAEYFVTAGLPTNTGAPSVRVDGLLDDDPQSVPGVVLGLPPSDEGEAVAFRDNPASIDRAERERLRREAEVAEFEEIAESLRAALRADPELAALSRNLMIDHTREGLRIQIVDQDRRSMFPSGSAAMYAHTRALLTQVVRAVQQTDKPVSVTGHTDATPFRAASGTDNWQLSADRANAARRALVDLGLDGTRVARVVGKAATEPLDPDNPTAPKNRRISIVLLHDGPPEG